MSLVFLSVALLVTLSPALACAGTIDSCLPAGVKSTDVVGVRVERGKGMTVTVAEKKLLRDVTGADAVIPIHFINLVVPIEQH